MSLRVKVLYLCTGNSCRCKMAEGFARALKGERMEAYSAGSVPQGLNPDISSNFVARGTRCGRLRGLMHFFRAKTY